MSKKDYTLDDLRDHVERVNGNVAFERGRGQVVVVPCMYCAGSEDVLRVPYSRVESSELERMKAYFGEESALYTGGYVHGQMIADGAAPRVLIMVPNYWGVAPTVDGAWDRVRQESSKSKRELMRGPWKMFFGHRTDEVPLYVNELGAVCHHSRYPVHQIDECGGPKK